MEVAEIGGKEAFYWRVQVRQTLGGQPQPLCDVLGPYGHSLSLEELYTSVLGTYVPETQRDGLQAHSVTGHTALYVLARAVSVGVGELVIDRE